MSDERNSKGCVLCIVWATTLQVGLWALFGTLAWFDKPGWGWVLPFAILATIAADCRKFCLSCEEYLRTNGK